MIKSIFRFRTRSPERDRETDRTRFERLREALDAVAFEIDRERDGLERRYASASIDAGFLMETLQNDEGSDRDSARIGDLTNTIDACEKRIASLKRQSRFMDECDAIVARFVAENDLADERPRE